MESLRAKKEKWVEVEQENLRIKAQLKEMEEVSMGQAGKHWSHCALH